MASNIDYIYHPPIEIGIHTPASQGSGTDHFDFLQHLASPSKTRQSNSYEPSINEASASPVGNGTSGNQPEDDSSEGPERPTPSVEEKTTNQHEGADETDKPEAGLVKSEQANADATDDEEESQLIDHGGIQPIDDLEVADQDEVLEGDVELTTEKDGRLSNSEATPAASADENETLPEKTKATGSHAQPTNAGAAIPATETTEDGTEAKATESPEKTDRGNENGQPRAADGTAVIETSEGDAEGDQARSNSRNAELAASTSKQDVSHSAEVQGARRKSKADSEQGHPKLERSALSSPAAATAKESVKLPSLASPSSVTEELNARTETEAQEQSPEIRLVEESNRTADRPQVSGQDGVVQESAKPQPRDTLSSVFSRARNVDSAPTQLTESQQARLMQRVAKAFDIARTRGEPTVRLRLSPPELGSLQLELQVERGSLIARMEVETKAAREVLLENLPTLRQRLSEQNITVDQFDVDLLDRHADEDWRGGQSQHPLKKGDSGTERGTTETSQKDEPTTDPRISRERWIDDQIIDVII